VSLELPALDPEVAKYVASSYPHNLDYRVVGGSLRPRWKLRRRMRKLARGYARPLTELLDLSSSKGYFVLEAASRPECQRALGIDVHAPDLAASRAVAAHLGLERASFQPLVLTQLAQNLRQFGGPFETVLLVNTYPYLYFGSDRSDDHVADHDELFRMLAEVTSKRLVFSNRIELGRCPRHIQARARELGLADGYRPELIRAACERYFELDEQKPLGKIPLWFLTKRRGT
jgi:hypothetical protein